MKIEQMVKEHHIACYGKEKFIWKWQRVDYIGIWAFGGSDENQQPIFISAEFQVPKIDKELGWYCYLGPVPDFHDNIG